MNNYEIEKVEELENLPQEFSVGEEPTGEMSLRWTEEPTKFSVEEYL